MGGAVKENPGLKPLKIVCEFVGLKPHANPKSKAKATATATATTTADPYGMTNKKKKTTAKMSATGG
jgi:hypothetical protein